MSEKEVMTVRAIVGHNGVMISRRDDGKVVLFSETDPLTASIREGDVVSGTIDFEGEKHIVLRPQAIKGKGKLKTTKPVSVKAILRLGVVGGDKQLWYIETEDYDKFLDGAEVIVLV